MTTSSEAEIRALLERRHTAHQAKDLDLLMSFYTPGIVCYDAVAPLRFTGTEEVRRNFARWFDGYEGPISLQTHDLIVRVDGDLAFAFMLHLDSGQRKDTGLQAAVWVRETVCLLRTEGGWKIIHEHVSIPFDLTTFRPWLPAEKDDRPV
ncbi:YybH family protein [Kitasatospora sp. NPDC048407]|uniref:YybH family protein n=1 Tax=Kitasatospora sp. NPDC048407 TaxID=3364051 RepID=UPI00371275F6